MSAVVQRASILLLALLLVGCAAPKRRIAIPPREALEQIGLDESTYVEAVDARCTPPHDWQIEPLKESPKHKHQLWISPSKNTAYGVIHFSLPFPVHPELVLPFFLQQMRDTEGEATLVEKKRDDEIDALRFIADGKQYRVRSILMTRGWEGWVIYAGTKRDHEENAEELNLAEEARENTRIDATE